VDTSELNVHQLKAIINRDFAGKSTSGEMAIAVLSFGFRYGTPREADLMMDVRFLPNPNFMPGMKEKTGLDRKVAAKVLENKDGRQFIEKLEALLEFLIPRYRTEGKSYLTIGIGCTGGRHRSVAVAERIGADLTGKKLHVSIVHRDLERT
jgi:RNase adapter protein RapZ